MKEIKFRAYVDTDEFKGVTDITNINFISKTHVEFIEPKTGKYGDYWDYEVMQIGEDCILLQYTGVKDKNGKEIYEGDIVEFDDGDRYYIDFAEGTFTMEPNRMYICNVNTENFCVIGNIYENPELLKGE